MSKKQTPQINQTIGLTCKVLSVRMTLMHRKNRLAAECSRKKFSLKQLFEAMQRVRLRNECSLTSCSKQPEPELITLKFIFPPHSLYYTDNTHKSEHKE